MYWIASYLFWFFLWALTGHLFWRLITWPFTESSTTNCTKCNKKILVADKACRYCGWTSVPIDVKKSLVICRQTLDAALKRGLIDQSTVDRAHEILIELEKRVAIERQERRSPVSESLSNPVKDVPGYTPSVISERIDKESVGQAQLPTPQLPTPQLPTPQLPTPKLPTPKLSAPPNLPVANTSGIDRPRAQIPRKVEVHALEQDYEDPTPREKLAVKEPTRTWTQLLSAFMEESNIRWGEIIGGLLIVCCSTALVISFWEHIASRPWLKFSIFTGINVSTFALGLYAWHRWKLPTTSKGILVIGMMQMPLNFLAFALFTHRMPWDWQTVAGEMLSMAILGYLAYQAAKILTPGALLASTCAPIAFGLANLLIRRTVDEEASIQVLYSWTLGLISLYSIVMVWVRKPLIRDAKGNYAPALEFFAISTFGLLLSCGLLLRCSEDPMESFRLLSPLLVLLGTPALLVSLDIGRRLEEPSSLQVPMLLLGTFAIAIAGLGVLFSWPTPLLMIATGVGLLGMIAAAGLILRNVGLIYPASIIASVLAVLLWFCLTGQMDWMNQSSVSLIDTLASPSTGFIWVGYSLLCLAVSLVLAWFKKPSHSSAWMHSAWISGGLGTLVLTAFGFGRAPYSTSLSALYGLYAVIAFGIAINRRKPNLEILASGFLVSASYQWIMVGWTSYDLTTRVYATLLCIALSLITMLLVQSATSYRITLEQPGTSALLVALILLTCDSLIQSSIFEPLIVASLLWFVFAWLTSSPIYWQTTQLIATAGAIAGVAQACVASQWWPVAPGELRMGFVHPLFLQYLALTLFSSGVCILTLAAILRLAKSPIARRVAGPLLAIHELSIAKLLIGVGTLLTIGIMVYGVIPGASQEILPRDTLSATQSISYLHEGTVTQREVPQLSNLELRWVPHAAASWGVGSDQYRVWGLPPNIAAWSMSLVALIGLCWILKIQGDTTWPYYAGVLVIVFTSIWYPIATLAEPSVSVASSLRWLSSGSLFLACIILSAWIRKVDRAKEPEASGSFALFDQLFSAISLHTFLSWLGMGILVGASVLMQSRVPPGFSVFGYGLVWGVVVVMALGAMILVLQGNAADSLGVKKGVSAWGIATSIMLLAPLLAWGLLQIALTLIDHPITGPNPDSFFTKIGLAASYATPILLLAIGLIAVAASRPDPKLAFIAAIFLMCSVVAGYLLVLKSRGVSLESWTGLCAILSGIASIYGLIWQFISSRDHRSGQLLHWPGIDIPQWRQDLQLALSRISIGFAIAGLGVVFALVLLPTSSSLGLSLGSTGILAAILMHFAQAYRHRQNLNTSVWYVAGSVALMGIVAPCFKTPIESLGAAGGVMFLSGVIVVLNTFKSRTKEVDIKESRFAIWWVLGIMLCLGLRAFLGSFPATTPASMASVVPLGILAGAWFLAALTVWRQGDRITWVWSLFLAHITGLVYSSNFISSAGLAPFPINGGLLLQIAIAACSSVLATCSGFGARSRIPLIAGTIILFLLSAVWLLVSLSDIPSATIVFAPQWYAISILSCVIGGASGFWNAKSKDEHAVLYLAGLSGVVCLIQLAGVTSEHLFWFATIAFSAYCLASSFLWSAGGRIQDEMTKLLRLPSPEEKPRWMIVVPLNIVLALGVTLLGIISQFVQASQNLRFISANAIMAVTFASGFLARYASIRGSTTPIRVLSLALGVFYAIALFWHVQANDTPWIWRLAVASLPLVLTATLYGFGLIKWLGGKEEWEQASLVLIPWVVAIAIGTGVASVLMEMQRIGFSGTAASDLYPVVCLILSFTLSILLSLAAALLPGKDPLGLSDRGREAYVYAVQAILVMLIIHLRITMPFLFTGLLQSIWPLLIVAIGFAGVGIAEWADRRNWRVLSNPLRNSGSMLPLLPILAPWISPSQVDQGVTMMASAVGYGMLGYYRASPIYITAGILCANIAFWQFLQKNDFAFARHPQLWVIPPALCVFSAGQFFKGRMTPKQLASVRYASIGSIYVASTSELFLQGISQAPWLPIVLAFLSILGILFGIAARIRSMLWLGSMFLAVALLSILWYAAVDLEQTWIWYVCGIVLGALMLFVFAMFEKRREELKRIVSNLQAWEE